MRQDEEGLMEINMYSFKRVRRISRRKLKENCKVEKRIRWLRYCL